VISATPSRPKAGRTGGRGAGRFYSVFSETDGRFRDRVRRHAVRKRVLEIGCGTSSMAFELSPVATSVLGIDISPVAVGRLRRRALEEGSENVRFGVMDAECLDVEDGSVDLLFATGVLHHLDIARAGAELARVLSPGGSAHFLEPTGHNPLINAYRDRTPWMRTPDEHPLVRDDFTLLGRWFETVDTEFQHLSAIASVPLRSWRSHRRIVRALNRVDAAVFAAVLPVRHHAWFVDLQLAGPRREALPDRG